MNKVLVQVPFQGFYQSVHDVNLDNCIESELEHLELNYDDCEIKIDRAAYCVQYVETVKGEYNLKFLEFESLSSPKEYNFETDRIFAYADLNELVGLLMVNKDGFKKWLIERMAPCSGFIPHYSNDLLDWGNMYINWDFNQWGLLLEYFHNVVAKVDELYLIENPCEYVEVLANEN